MSQGFDTTYFIASLLMVPGGALLTGQSSWHCACISFAQYTDTHPQGKVVISIAQWGSRMVNVASLANFITAAEGGEAAAAAGTTSSFNDAVFHHELRLTLRLVQLQPRSPPKLRRPLRPWRVRTIQRHIHAIDSD